MLAKKRYKLVSLQRLFMVFLTVVVLFISSCTARATEDASSKAQNTPATTRAAPAQAKPTYTVQRGDISVQILLSGSVAAVEDAQLHFRADDRVRHVYVKVGDHVQQGQVLAELEQAAGLQSRQEADALELKRAELRMEIAFIEYAALQDQLLTERQKRYDLPVKQKLYELAEVDLEAVRLRVNDLSRQIEDAQIVAPMDGEVFAINIKEGDTIQAYDPVIEIANPTQLEIRVYPDAVTLKNIHEGLPVRFERRNAPGVTFTGQISRLPRPAVGNGKAQDTAVHIAFEATPALADLSIAEYIDITFELAHKEAVLWLPPQAVRVFEGRNFAVVREGEQQRRVDLEIGLKTAERVEILSGLQEGEIVVGQ